MNSDKFFRRKNIARKFACGKQRVRSPRSPHQQTQKEVNRKVNLFCWCGKRDLNPYIKDTRPSNVRVCRFRHSRERFTIIKHYGGFVKGFLIKNVKKSFLFFSPKFLAKISY